MQNENKQQKGSAQDSDPDVSQLNNRRLISRLLWIVVLFGISFWLWSGFEGSAGAAEISYSSFRGHVQEGRVTEVSVSGERLEGGFESSINVTTADGESITTDSFFTFIPAFGDDQLLTLLEENEVEVRIKPESGFALLPLIINLLPFLLLGGLAYFYLRRMQSRGQSIFQMGESRAKLYDRRQERTTFDDVAGAHGAKTELREIIEFLKEPDRFHRLGGTIPRGVLLVGPPGTGKTLLARAVAGEAEVPFFSITGSDFMEMFVGVGASRVRDLFKEAKKVSPSIVFIDELDSIGRTRGAGLGGGHDEREQTLNQLLSELDGFEPNASAIVMAATNRPDILDPALLRPGRFDRRITVDLPAMKDRLEILKIHSRNKPLDDEASLENIAKGTPGFSGADLENLLNEAALLAARKGKDEVQQEDIEEARDKVLMGLERRNLALTDKEKKMIAFHEGGHALIAALLPDADPLHKVTIVPRGHAMGVTQQLPERDKYLFSREYMLDRLAVMMGGRAAEEIVFDTATSGAENDLKQATQLARKMVLDWGMSKLLGNVALGSDRQQIFLGEELSQRRTYSESTAREIDQEIKGILDAAYQRARKTLQDHRKTLNELAAQLVEHEELSGKQVLDLLRKSGADVPEAVVEREKAKAAAD